jgi:hypothetical protein
MGAKAVRGSVVRHFQRGPSLALPFEKDNTSTSAILLYPAASPLIFLYTVLQENRAQSPSRFAKINMNFKCLASTSLAAMLLSAAEMTAVKATAHANAAAGASGAAAVAASSNSNSYSLGAPARTLCATSSSENIAMSLSDSANTTLRTIAWVTLPAMPRVSWTISRESVVPWLTCPTRRKSRRGCC